MAEPVWDGRDDTSLENTINSLAAKLKRRSDAQEVELLAPSPLNKELNALLIDLIELCKLSHDQSFIEKQLRAFNALCAEQLLSGKSKCHTK